MYKIVFTDIDGTLLGPERALTKATIAQIAKLKDKVPFILVSSRMPRQMYHLQEQLNIKDLPLIAYNGAYIIKNGHEIHSTEIPIDIVEKLVLFNDTKGKEKIHLSLFNADDWFVESMDYWAIREETNTKASPEIKTNKDVVAQWENEGKGPHKIMCMGEKEKIDAVFEFLENRFGHVLHLYRSKDTYIEIAHKKVSKLTGIHKTLQHCYPHIDISETVAFGDNYNDIEMLAGVGYGIAVGNARDEVKKVANQIAKHHKEDGVAISLEELFNI